MKNAEAGALSCQELVELVTDYLEDALPEDERRRFETHLAGCRGCQRYLDQIRRTIRTLGRITEDDLGADARDDLLRTFQQWKRERG